MNILYETDIRRYEKTLKSFLGLDHMNTSDYVYKSKLLKNNVPLYLTQAQYNERQEIIRDLPINSNFRDSLADKFGFCAILESYRLNDSYKHRISRLRGKISKLLSSDSNFYFLTFTFKDSILDSTDFDTRRQYVRRWLSKNCIDYIGNLDYGEKNHREHYHALISCDRVDTKTWLKNGALNFEKVYIDSTIDDKLAKYINKFMYHAIKETTKRQHIIYKRSIK